jgi:beta-lactamase class A
MLSSDLPKRSTMAGKRSSGFNIFGIAVYLLCCMVIGVAIFYTTEYFESSAQTAQQTTQILSSQEVKEESPTSTPESSPQPTGLESAVKTALEGTKGKYAVGIKNLKTGEEYYLNQHEKFESGSLYKLWVMGETFHKVETGELMMEDSLSATYANLNQTFGIDPENAEFTSGGITQSVAQALNQMITISHNGAAMLLTRENKTSTIKKWIDDHGFTESDVGGDPATSAHDMVKFFDDLQAGKLGNPESTEKMLKMLKDQRLNRKLPADLPNNVEIAHKTGELGMFTHDAGIVYTDKGDYIIAILSESETPAAAEKRIAEVSKAVYDYFQSK